MAHGIGSRHDLPISPFYAYAGAFAALLVSFLALGLLWSTSRFRGEYAGRSLPALLQQCADAPATRTLLRALGTAAALFTLYHLLAGPDDPDRNPAPAMLHVLLWAGLVPASLLLGPVWRLVNPLRAIHTLACRAAGRDPAAGRPLPARTGQWPAAAGLLAYTWCELAAPDPASTTTVLLFLTAHGVVQLSGAARYGARWFGRGDPFEVYSSLLARLSPFGRRADGRLVVRNPMNGLDAAPALPGGVAVVCVLLGSTAYDGFADTPSWITTLQTAPLGRTCTATLGLLGALALVAAAYTLCAGAAHLLSGRRPHLPGAFAHSLVPIALGYLIAHYFSLFATEAPRTVSIALGTDNPPVPPAPLGPGGLAGLQVGVIITGHVLGVVAAHDRAVRLFPPHRAIAGQLPMLLLMICYTVGGLTLLLA